jgi:hypothetical protein
VVGGDHVVFETIHFHWQSSTTHYFLIPFFYLLEVSRIHINCCSSENMSSGESVYRLIPPPEEKIVKPSLYRSKYPGDAPPTGSTIGLKGTSKFITNVGGEFVDPDTVGYHKTKKTGGHWGTGTARRNPDTFTKKREKDIILPESMPSLLYEFFSVSFSPQLFPSCLSFIFFLFVFL